MLKTCISELTKIIMKLAKKKEKPTGKKKWYLRGGEYLAIPKMLKDNVCLFEKTIIFIKKEKKDTFNYLI